MSSMALMARSLCLKLVLGMAVVMVVCVHRCSVSAFAFTAPLSQRSLSASSSSSWDRRAQSSAFGARGLRSRCALRAAGAATGATTAASRRGRGGLSMARETLILTEENVIAVLAEAKLELGTLFGNNAENTAVGITGNVEFVCLDGPSVVVRLSGRFWHEKTTVLSRVANYVLTRIPECIDVEIEDPAQLEDADKQGRGQGAEM